MAVHIELNLPNPGHNDLMWAYVPPPEDPDAVPRPFRVESFKLWRSDQPDNAAGQWDERALVPNTPRRSSLGFGGPMTTSSLAKVYAVDHKESDLTWHYKVQRLDWKGNVHPDDGDLDDLVPRTITSFEEYNSGYRGSLRAYAGNEMHKTITVPAAATLADPLIFDFVKRYGGPVNTVEINSGESGLVVVQNNVNNHRVVLTSTTDIPYRHTFVNVWTLRLLFENTTASPIDVDLKFVVGAHP